MYFHCTILNIQTAFVKRFCDFRKEKIFSIIAEYNIFYSCKTTYLELEGASIADKHVWVSKFQSLNVDLKNLACQKAILAQNHKLSDIENLLNWNKHIFYTWNAISDFYINLKKYAFGVL